MMSKWITFSQKKLYIRFNYEIVKVATDEAKIFACLAAEKEKILCGISSGAALLQLLL